MITKHTAGGGTAQIKTQTTGMHLLFNIECYLIKTTKHGNRGAQVMDVANMNGHENINPKYLIVEMNKATYISVKVHKSSDKSRVQSEGGLL